MNYKISDICSSLGIGKSTVYDRIKILKRDIPESDWKNNDYFYYTSNNKLFFTEKGFLYIKDFNSKTYKNRQNLDNDVSLYQNQLLEFYKQRVEYLENENKRLLDIISVKEQKEIANTKINLLGNSSVSEDNSFFSKFFSFFKK